MKTPLELAAEHARVYVANRGWRVELILTELASAWNACDCEDAA